MNKLIWTMRIFFLVAFLLSAYYIAFVETEKYESETITSLKDLTDKQDISLGAVLLGKGTEGIRDSKVLELFIKSHEMYEHLNTIFHLDEYYASKKLDFFQRLDKNAILPMFQKNQYNLLHAYQSDLSIYLDNLSETLTIKFAHADANVSRAILQEIIHYADQKINAFSRENARISLSFIRKQVEENRKHYIQTIKKLIVYQQKHHTFDPTFDVERKNKILAELEAELTKKEVEYSSKKRTGWNINAYDMKTLKANIVDIKRSIAALKRELSGNENNKSFELNSNVFDFEILKNEMEFAKTVYKQTLINQERLKMEVSQNAKHLSIISHPTLPDSYTYPDKLWDIFTLILGLLMLYGIIITVIIVLRDHMD